jgi:hypothetical protein
MNRCYFHKNFPNSGQIVSTVLATSETLQAPAAEFWAVGFSEIFWFSIQSFRRMDLAPSSSN